MRAAIISIDLGTGAEMLYRFDINTEFDVEPDSDPECPRLDMIDISIYDGDSSATVSLRPDVAAKLRDKLTAALLQYKTKGPSIHN